LQKSAHSTLVDGMPTLPHPTNINFVNFSLFAVLEFSHKAAVHVYVHTVTAMSQILLHHACTQVSSLIQLHLVSLQYICTAIRHTPLDTYQTKLTLVPGLAQLFVAYRKVRRAWYLFSREHDVIDRWQKRIRTKSEVSCIVQPTKS